MIDVSLNTTAFLLFPVVINVHLTGNIHVPQAGLNECPQEAPH
jgi:hypothetical protein